MCDLSPPEGISSFLFSQREELGFPIDVHLWHTVRLADLKAHVAKTLRWTKGYFSNTHVCIILDLTQAIFFGLGKRSNELKNASVVVKHFIYPKPHCIHSRPRLACCHLSVSSHHRMY